MGNVYPANKTRNNFGNVNQQLISRSNSPNSQEAIQDEISPTKKGENKTLSNTEQNQINEHGEQLFRNQRY